MVQLFAQALGGAEGQVPIWYEIAVRFGLPVAMLVFVVWHYLKTTAEHAKGIAAKDKEIAALNDRLASTITAYHSWFVQQVANLNERHQAEVTRVNERRVQEAHEHMTRMYERDEASMEMLQQADKTLTTILEKLR